MRSIRIFVRLCGVMAVVTEAALMYLFTIKWAGRAGSYPARAAWLHRACRHMLAVLNVKATYEGVPPTRGVMVSNHITYLDILVHSANTPLIFISKAEVDNWPIFGALTRWAGSIFIRRELRKDVRRVADAMPAVVEQGSVLTFFPEGTSSDGSGVLPFRPSLLAPIVEYGWPVTPAFVHYSLEPGDGTVEHDVAYYRPETVFGLHIFRLLGRRRIEAKVTYGEPRQPGPDRKALACQLRETVCTLGGV